MCSVTSIVAIVCTLAPETFTEHIYWQCETHSLILSERIHWHFENSFIDILKTHSLTFAKLIHWHLQNSFIDISWNSFIDIFNSFIDISETHSLIFAKPIHWNSKNSFIDFSRNSFIDNWTHSLTQIPTLGRRSHLPTYLINCSVHSRAQYIRFVFGPRTPVT